MEEGLLHKQSASDTTEASESTTVMRKPPPRSSPPATKRRRIGSPSGHEAVLETTVDPASSSLEEKEEKTSKNSAAALKKEPPSSADTPESSPVAASPTTAYYTATNIPLPPAGELPPAPPSTPASSRDGITLLPPDDVVVSYNPIENASELEKALYRNCTQQHTAIPTTATLQEEPTPHPSHTKTKSSTATTLLHPGVLMDDFSDWAVGDRYEMMRMLGRGSYGEVAQAKDLWWSSPATSATSTAATNATTTSHSPFVAIKRITSAFDHEIDAIRLYREMHILRRLRGHECIIHLLDVVQPPTDDPDDFHDLYLVFEYVDTDLYKLIMSPQYLTTEHIQTFLYQMLAGLQYTHSANVIHRDLKPANILLNEDCSLKICDFGLARIVTPSDATESKRSSEDLAKSSESSSTNDGASSGSSSSSGFGPAPPRGLTRQLTKHVVTRWYRAPELILVQPYTSAVDIWSLGCILAELLSMQEGNVPDYQDRMPLFPGGSCFPLSGEGTSMNKEERVDQLSVIFGVIGIPDDLESIGMAPAYRKAILAKGKELKSRPIETIYPASDPAAIELLKDMLKFDPKERCTAEQALKHNFFKNVRGGEQEMEMVASEPLRAPEFLESHKIDLGTLKHRIIEEVRCYEDLHHQKNQRQHQKGL